MAFQTTQWSVVLAAQQSDPVKARAGLERLCTTYWRPVYAYIRHKGYSADDAKDLTQEFFVRFIDKGLIQRYDPERGRFRTFLLTALRSFIHDEWRQSQTIKRGGQQQIVPIDTIAAENDYLAGAASQTSPERLFERHWATTMLERALASLRAEYEESHEVSQFDALKPFLTVEDVQPKYRELAETLGMTEGALKTAVHRLRKRYRDVIRRTVRETCVSKNEVDDELRQLLDALSE